MILDNATTDPPTSQPTHKATYDYKAVITARGTPSQEKLSESAARSLCDKFGSIRRRKLVSLMRTEVKKFGFHYRLAASFQCAPLRSPTFSRDEDGRRRSNCFRQTTNWWVVKSFKRLTPTPAPFS